MSPNLKTCEVWLGGEIRVGCGQGRQLVEIPPACSCTDPPQEGSQRLGVMLRPVSLQRSGGLIMGGFREPAEMEEQFVIPDMSRISPGILTGQRLRHFIWAGSDLWGEMPGAWSAGATAGHPHGGDKPLKLHNGTRAGGAAELCLVVKLAERYPRGNGPGNACGDIAGRDRLAMVRWSRPL